MKKAQSILEYIIILAAIVGTVIWAAGKNGPVRGAVEQMFTDSTDLMENKTGEFLDQAAGGYNNESETE